MSAYIQNDTIVVIDDHERYELENTLENRKAFNLPE